MGIVRNKKRRRGCVDALGPDGRVFRNAIDVPYCRTRDFALFSRIGPILGA